MSTQLHLAPTEQAPTGIGLFIRIHTDVRSFHSDFAMLSTGTVAGLYANPRTSIMGGKDLHFTVGEPWVATPAGRDELVRVIRSLKLDPTSCDIARKIDDFFEKASTSKKAGLDQFGDVWTQQQATDIQNDINTKAVRVKCIHVSARRQEATQFPGSRLSKRLGLYCREEKLCKVYVPIDFEATADKLLDMLRETSMLDIQADIKYTAKEIKKESKDSSSQKVSIRVERATETDIQTVRMQQAAKAPVRSSYNDMDWSQDPQSLLALAAGQSNTGGNP